MRIVRALLNFGFWLAGAAIVALVLALFLAATGRNLPMLRSVVGGLGRTIAGQRTEALTLQVRLNPEAKLVDGNARLTVRAAAADRERLYFLLNDGLRIRDVWEEQGTTRTPLRAFRVWILTVVELPRALAADESITIGLSYAGEPQRAGLAGSGSVFNADNVVLAPADFWYPSDVQGFFDATVEVALPSHLELAHNGREISRLPEGTTTRVRWTTERPVPGLALVAGRYRRHSDEREGVRFEVLLGEDINLAPDRLLDSLAAAEQGLRAHYGPSGFPRVTLFVNRQLARAFNDGSGLLGISPRYFSDGDYGYETIAHEIAHNYWGGTVAERWLDPGTGGEWIVEGFAEFSGWRAVREHFGEAALLRTLAANSFDPDRTRALEAMSVLDNGLDPQARPTIYNKGGYVTFMLEQQLGAEGFDAAARALLEQRRHQSATATDVETIFAATSGQDLAPFFNAWVRGNESIDLALEPQDGNAVARNLRTAPAPATLGLWRFTPGGEPERQTTTLGAATPVGNAERILIDPQALVADMFRSNNVLPRRERPRAVGRSARGQMMIVRGEPVGWEAATVDVLGPTGAVERSWVIDPGLVGTPAWSADGSRILAVESPRADRPTLLALNPADGSRQTVARDAIATGAADATIVARGDRLIRLAGRDETVLAEHPDGRVGAPLASPDSQSIAYAVAFGATMELRVRGAGEGDNRILLTWPTGPLRWRWAPDGKHLFAVLTGSWDWQLWELAADGSGARALAREAAGISDLAVAPDGSRIALAAQPELDDPYARHQVFVVDRQSAAARPYELSGWSASSIAWLDDEALAIVVSNPEYPVLPPATELRKLRLADGALEPFGN